MASQKYLNLLKAFFAKQQPLGIPGAGPYTGAPPADATPALVASEIARIDARGGVVYSAPDVLLCTCPATVKEGMAVAIDIGGGYDATNLTPRVRICDPNVVINSIPIGHVLYKPSDLVCAVSIGAGAELISATAVQHGAIYYVGTDGYPAKTGDANFPTSGQVKAVVGVGITPNIILRTLNLLTTTF